MQQISFVSYCMKWLSDVTMSILSYLDFSLLHLKLMVKILLCLEGKSTST